MNFSKIIKREKIEKLHNYNEIISEIYPELKVYLKNNVCCNERVKENYRVISAICMLGGIDRNINKLVLFTSVEFVNNLSKVRKQESVSLNTIFQVQSEYLIRQCLDCTKEHIAKAILWLIQYKKDPKEYATDYWLAIGELGHAEMECIDLDKAMSLAIRNEKKKLIENKNTKLNLLQFLK
jgi:hypothetical protein